MEVKAFRGQHGLCLTHIQTRLPSISFGSLKSAKIYATHPNNLSDTVIKPIVLSATIQIQNPIIDNKDDCFADFDKLIEKLGEAFMWHMADKFETHIYNTDNWEYNYSNYKSILGLKLKNPTELKNLYIEAYILLDDKEFIAHSKKFGYDGAIHIGNGQTKDELEYKIFSEEQILEIQEIVI